MLHPLVHANTSDLNEQKYSTTFAGEGFKELLSTRPEMSQAIIGELVRRMRGLMQQR